MVKATASLIRLADPDNVLIVSTTLEVGAQVEIAGEIVRLDRQMSLGHKVAARAIKKGEKILKYNFPIGIATEDIPLGAHVHVHNVRSNYTQTYIIKEA